ncbi:MAG: fibronectin type III domain-containing protein [Clostridia bacterium]|nr:fibronectin type III domain-containing protein [Clostridia bacterium]
MNSFAKRMGSLLLCLMLLTSGMPVNAIAEALEPATPAEATEKTDEFDETKSEEACAHAQAVSSVDEERSYWPIGDEQHSVTVLQHEVCICPDCGEVLKDESIEIDAYAEEHAYNDEGVCPACGQAVSFAPIMPLSLDLDIVEGEPTKAMSIYVNDIVVGQSFSFSWDEVPYADHYEVSIVRIDQKDQEHHITGSADVTYRQNVGTNRSFTVSAADVAADTKRIRIYVGAASAAFPCPAGEMIKDITTTVDARYEENKEMDVAVSVNGSTAVVDWPEVDGADHYRYKVLDEKQELIPETETSGLSFRIDDLLSGHRYKIWVAAYAADGEVIVQHASESKLLVECDHALTMDVDPGGRYGNISADTHTLYGLFDIQCKSCGEVLQKDQIKNLGTEAHQFTGDVCKLCGYDRSAQDAALALTVGEAISGKPLTVSWNEIAGADHYQYSARDLTTDAALCNETTAGTTFTLEGANVAADHEYKLWAAAFDADGLMLTQATSQVTATKPEVKLVLNVGAAIGGQTLIATWNEIEDADHYQYNIRNLSTDTPIWGEAGQSTQIPSLMLNGILVDDNVEYKIWVGAFDASGAMMAQTTQTVKTSAAQSNPMNLSYSGTPLAGVDLAMAWSKLTDAVRYEYSLRDVTTNTSIYSREKTEAAYFTIPGAKLEANHSYRFWVGAIGESGAEPDGNHQGSVSFTVVQCPHGSAAHKNEVATRTSISDTQHRVVTKYDLYCTYCDTVLEKGKTEEYDEKHSFDENGNCMLCGYEQPLAVTVKADAQSGWTGDMLGADAVVSGGSGSYTYYWEVYRNKEKVDYTTDARDRYTYTANEEGQWKFVVLVTDKEDDETFWAESAVIEVKKCDHAPVSEEISDRRKIEHNDQKTHVVVKTMHVTCACGEVDKTEEVRETVEHTKGSASNKTGHPHRKYYVCTVCGQEIDGGEDGYDARCSTCNPPKTGNSGNQNSQQTNSNKVNQVDTSLPNFGQFPEIQGPVDERKKLEIFGFKAGEYESDIWNSLKNADDTFDEFGVVDETLNNIYESYESFIRNASESIVEAVTRPASTVSDVLTDTEQQMLVDIIKTEFIPAIIDSKKGYMEEIANLAKASEFKQGVDVAKDLTEAATDTYTIGGQKFSLEKLSGKLISESAQYTMEADEYVTRVLKALGQSEISQSTEIYRSYFSGTLFQSSEGIERIANQFFKDMVKQGKFLQGEGFIMVAAGAEDSLKLYADINKLQAAARKAETASLNKSTQGLMVKGGQNLAKNVGRAFVAFSIGVEAAYVRQVCKVEDDKLDLLAENYYESICALDEVCDSLDEESSVYIACNKVREELDAYVDTGKNQSATSKSVQEWLEFAGEFAIGALDSTGITFGGKAAQIVDSGVRSSNTLHDVKRNILDAELINIAVETAVDDARRNKASGTYYLTELQYATRNNVIDQCKEYYEVIQQYSQGELNNVQEKLERALQGDFTARVTAEDIGKDILYWVTGRDKELASNITACRNKINYLNMDQYNLKQTQELIREKYNNIEFPL